ncbi:MAG: HEAT repeat domain-containing protein [Elusimicrobia bacterium]|nr:HEAT repeat domain-containing protein [Elusimicrobiota bacterium]
MIPGLLLLAALALPAPAADPAAAADREVRAVFVKLEGLLARQSGADARAVAALGREIESLAPAVLRWKWRAVAPLERVMTDPARPVKSRLYALSFLSLTGDPLAFPPLRRLLLDPGQPAALRSAAAAGLAGLGASRQARRAALCAALAQEDIPDETARAALLEASRLGCDEASVLEDRARRGGLRPEGAAARDAELAAAGLGRSFPISAARALARLLGFYPAGSPLKTAVLRALWEKRRDLPALRAEAAGALTAAIRSESGRPESIAAAAAVLASLDDPGHVPLLRRLLSYPDAEVATAAAEALAQLQVFPAREDIARLLARVHEDKRFAPQPGRPAPHALIERLQAAQRRLR